MPTRHCTAKHESRFGGASTKLGVDRATLEGSGIADLACVVMSAKYTSAWLRWKHAVGVQLRRQRRTEHFTTPILHARDT